MHCHIDTIAHSTDDVDVHIRMMYCTPTMKCTARSRILKSPLQCPVRMCKRVELYASVHNENTILLSGLMITLKDGKDFSVYAFHFLFNASHSV